MRASAVRADEVSPGGIDPARSLDRAAGFVIVLLVLHLAVALGTVARAERSRMLDDARRFTEIAAHEGRPYRDFAVEYAPVETIVITAIATDDLPRTARRLAAIALLGDLAAFAGMWRGWGRKAATAYLVLGLPLVPLMYARIDMLVVAIVVWGLALSVTARERGGGATLAIATLTKVWPIVIAPFLLVQRRSTGSRWYVGVLGAGTLAWVGFGGVSALRQVFTFRGATGWQIESTVGVVVRWITDDHIRFEAGSYRIGRVPGWSSGLLLMLLILAVTAIWWDASRRRDPRLGVPGLAALSALLTLSPVFSLQYAMWLIPFGALAWAEGERTDARLAFAIALLTGALTGLYLGGDAQGWDLSSIGMVVILVRNATCAYVPARRLWIAYRRPPVRTERASAAKV
jgi:hypothetical protein